MDERKGTPCGTYLSAATAETRVWYIRNGIYDWCAPRGTYEAKKYYNGDGTWSVNCWRNEDKK